jgi:hypothetical protein
LEKIIINSKKQLMSEAKKTETTVPNKAKSTKITATYVGRGVVQKEGPSKGKKFYKYNLSGPAAEIKEFMESDASKEYGVKYAADGVTPQYWCNWKDPFGTIGTVYSVRVSIYGTYVLDKEESYDIEDTLEALESRGLVTAARVYAENKLGSRLGFGLNRANVSRLAEVGTGEGADLGKAE